MKRILFISSLILLFSIQKIELFSQELREETWSFTQKDTLYLETHGRTKVSISGSHTDQIEIKLQYRFKPDEKFELNENNTSVILKERLLNYDNHRPTTTYFEDWILAINVPDGTYIKCKGGSSDFKINHFKGFFKADYGAGSFVIRNVEGTVDMLLAQLYARIHNSKGKFDLKSAGGAIRATGLSITGNSIFNSGTGSVRISLARVPDADLSVSSNFNKAQVSFNGNPVTGYCELIAMVDKGKIISPFKFDRTEIFLDDIKSYRDSSDFGRKSEYFRKSFTRGDNKPVITLKTVSGTAQLIK